MPSTISEYQKMETKKEAGRLSRRFWFAALSLCVIWTLLILAPPVSAAYGVTAVSDPLYFFFSHICHQDPSRSFELLAHKFGVCSRCFGVYFGLVAGFLAYPFFRNIDETEPLPRIWLILAMVPIGVDWSLTVFGIWENTFLSRFTSGLILGIACAVFVIPALSEIAYLMKQRRSRHPAAI